MVRLVTSRGAAAVVPSVAAVKSRSESAAFDVRLRPDIQRQPAVIPNQLVQIGGEIRHRLDVVDASRVRHAGSRCVHLRAGVLLHPQVARGQKQDLFVFARMGRLARMFGLARWPTIISAAPGSFQPVR